MEASDWIDVKYRKPKLNETVLVCRKLEDGSTYVDFAMRVSRDIHLHNIDIWYTEEGWDIDDVTHWQRIVYPKKEKEN